MFKVSSDKAEEVMLFPLCSSEKRMREEFRKMVLRIYHRLLADDEINISIEMRQEVSAAA